MKTVCIYHSRDLDGWMSAAIVKKWWLEINKPKNEKLISVIENKYQSDNGTIQFLGWDYGDAIPDLSEYDKVIMCDVSFPPEHMLMIHRQTELIWIDHHISAILDVEKSLKSAILAHSLSQGHPKGLRDTKFAACELTWKYFFSEEEMPEIVRLLGRYDCFGHKGTDEEQKVLEFQYGARQRISNYEQAYEHLNYSLNSKEGLNPVEDEISSVGSTIYWYLKTEAEQIYKHAFLIRLENLSLLIEGVPKVYKFLCVNKGGFNASSFNLPYTKDGYDGFASFTYSNSKKAWTFTLRSETIDVSVIAKHYGGGGHKGAAGFVIEDLSKIIK